MLCVLPVSHTSLGANYSLDRGRAVVWDVARRWPHSVRLFHALWTAQQGGPRGGDGERSAVHRHNGALASHKAQRTHPERLLTIPLLFTLYIICGLRGERAANTFLRRSPVATPATHLYSRRLCVSVCVLSSGCLVCRPSDLCVCRVGTPPAR